MGIETSLPSDIPSSVVKIEIVVNIDGVPLCKSTNSQLWPILGSLHQSKSVFPIAIFHGYQKPSSVDEFLADFINEVNNLTLPFVLKALICDAPARCFLKCIIGHTGYFSCERCDVKGERKENRTVFLSHDKPTEMRSGEEFSLQAYEGTHQKGVSPLTVLKVDCVLDFPLDYMHSVLLGVVKRLLVFLTKGPKKCRLSRNQVNVISQELLKLKLPSNFNRQPRSLNDLCYWKATEYRSFLLYVGPIALKGVVNSNTYKHFLALHVSMLILLNSEVFSNPDLIAYAKNLLNWFVDNTASVYGEIFCVYNVHALTHITDDVLHHGCSLNEISAFKFENYLQAMKKMVKNNQSPVVQIAKRLSERESFQVKQISKSEQLFKNNNKDVFFYVQERKCL